MTSTKSSARPKSIRQKQVLTVAEAEPNATLAEIAEEIAGATPAYVDRVLTQFGDPSNSSQESATDTAPTDDDTPVNEKEYQTDQAAAATTADLDQAAEADDPVESDSTGTGQSKQEPTDVAQTDEESTMSNNESPSDSTETSADAPQQYPDQSELTQKERKTLRTIARRPTATQKHIADELGVSRATVSNRVNAIPGFEWANRDTFVTEVVGEPDSHSEQATTEAPAEPAHTGTATSSDSTATTDSSTAASQPTTSAARANGTATASDARSAPDQTNNTREDAPTQHPRVVDTLETIEHELTKLHASVESEASSQTHAYEKLRSDGELLHKIVYACINSDRITEDEEMIILEALTR